MQTTLDSMQNHCRKGKLVEVLTLIKSNKDQGIKIELNGAFEEKVSLTELVGPFNGTLEVNCKGITRINSVGVKEWIRYFQSLVQQNKQFYFSECSPPVVEQFNVISNFGCGGKVESIYLPYSCTKCKIEFSAKCMVSDLLKSGLEVPAVNCEKENCEAVLDTDADEYFYFLDLY